jgi:hypothetical protein
MAANMSSSPEWVRTAYRLKQGVLDWPGKRCRGPVKVSAGPLRANRKIKREASHVWAFQVGHDQA